jgi:hypothetical protein
MTRSAAARVEETLGVEREKPASADPETALRAGIGRYTIDLLPDIDERGVATMVSNGQLGQPPIGGRVDVATVAAIVGAAGFVRARSVIHTAAWWV